MTQRSDADPAAEASAAGWLDPTAREDAAQRPPLPKDDRHPLAHLFASPPPRVRFVGIVLLIGGVLNGVLTLLRTVSLLEPNQVYARDFTQDYLWVRAVLDGVDPHQPLSVLGERYFGPVGAGRFPYPTPHPPTRGVIMLPLGMLDLHTASVIWLGIELLSLLGVVTLLCRLWGARRQTVAVPLIALLLLSWAPLTVEIANGQVMVILLLLAMLARACLVQGQLGWCGALIGLAICIKPVAAPLALLLLRVRSPRLLIGMLVPPAVLGVAALLVLGPGTLLEFVPIASEVSREYRSFVGNISVWAVSWKVFDGIHSAVQVGITAPPLIAAPALGAPVALVLVGATGALAVWALLRVERAEHGLGLLTAVSIVLSPIAWDHYLVLTLLPGAQAARRLMELGFPRRATNLALALGTLLLVPMVGWVPIAELLAGPGPRPPNGELPFAAAAVTLMPTVAVLALAWSFARLFRRD